METHDSWFARHHQGAAGSTIAYFCAEFALHNSIPVYSGGLGVLAGDHCKAASDLGVPLVAVGLFYVKGYFDQKKLLLAGWPQWKKLGLEKVTRCAAAIAENLIPIIIIKFNGWLCESRISGCLRRFSSIFSTSFISPPQGC